MRTTVCAIFPTFNRSQLLKESLNSVLAQSRSVDEIIVVNDGCTDDTESVVKSYGNRVNLLSKPNGGKSSALNLALEHSTSDYIWICDDDDIAAPDGLKFLAAALDADDLLGFVYGTFQIFEDNNSVRTFSAPKYSARKEEPDTTINFLEGMFTPQFTMLVRRSLYAKVGPFREDMIRSQDNEMAIRLSRHATAKCIPEVVFFQRKHSGERGWSSDRFSAENNPQKWRYYDQIMFSQLKAEIPLEEFTPSFARQLDSGTAKRAALIERACVFAKRGMWKDSVQDFQHAVELGGSSATTQELRLIEGVFEKIGTWDILYRSPEQLRDFHYCFRANNVGQSLVFAACRPLVWRMRILIQTGELLTGFQTLTMLVQLLGVYGTIQRVLLSIIR